MARDIDPRKTAKALRRLDRAVKAAHDPEGRPLSEWEAEFAQSVTERLRTYGSAFADPEKGSLDEPLSSAQTAVVRRMGKPKPTPKPPAKWQGKGFGRKSRRPANVRDISEL